MSSGQALSRRRPAVSRPRRENPPVLHRKETFLRPDDPRRAKFDRLTRQEERAGLLDDIATIGTRSGWADRLPEQGYALRGHRLVRTWSEAGPADTRAETEPHAV